ncbi:MAG: M24 family metallopeptidase, partial [Aristaeellaceae bacterium]
MTASDRLIEQLHLTATDAVAVHNPSNMFYLTQGYTGEGVVFISPRRRVIVTDFRYTEQAEKQAPGFEVVMTDKALTHSQWIARLCQQEGVTVLRYEDDFLTVADFRTLQDALGDDMACISLDQAPEILRVIKTDAEVAAIRRACQITSQAFDEILPKIHEGMTEKELQLELDYTMFR